VYTTDVELLVRCTLNTLHQHFITLDDKSIETSTDDSHTAIINGDPHVVDPNGQQIPVSGSGSVTPSSDNDTVSTHVPI
jgi:hypothetical protein